MAAVSSIIAGVAAGIAAAGTGYAVYAGERASDAQKQAMAEQKQAQSQAAAAAELQRQKSEMAMRAANRRQPDIAGIMQSAAEAGSGPSSTMLTGPAGVAQQDLALGRSTLLGG